MKRIDLRQFNNRLASGVISAGGFALIVIILGMMSFIVYQTLPLWQGSSIKKDFDWKTNNPDLVYLGEEEQREIIYTIDATGTVNFIRKSDQSGLQSFVISKLGLARIVSATATFSKHRIALGTDDGRIIRIEIKFNSLFGDNIRTIIPEVIEERPLKLFTHSPVKIHAYAGEENLEWAIIEKASSAIFVEISDTLSINDLPESAGITSAAINPIGKELILGFTDGTIARWLFHPAEKPELTEKIQIAGKSIAISALSYLIGDITLMVGDGDGNLSGWTVLKNNGHPTLTKIRDFESHPAAVRLILPSWRNKCFLSSDVTGEFRIYHATSNQVLVQEKYQRSAELGYFSPKGDGLLFLADAQVASFSLFNPHPETSWRTLFGSVWYESYEKPGYTWQSTGGTDDFESKFSLIPLIFGTLKATLYAMLFAAPLAILGALYTSQFAHPGIRNIIKPTVEIMAALPSVVIGFIAGLWLAPLLKNTLVEFVTILLLLPILIIVCVWAFDFLPKKWTNPFRHGYEVFLMIPTVLLCVGIGYLIGFQIEENLMAGDLQTWLYSELGVRFDQRNSIIVGVAMSFAVMPIIFTITEDALSGVPRQLTSASLALGATRWQTAIKVILPAASAGIFSAVMIGFGRAVGETMIVLMATGNTPIMDWSIFNGMRTLSANIAVEIPEAPEGGTLYRVLFLSGLLLFIITFFVNTLAEVVRQRLRKKYATMS